MSIEIDWETLTTGAEGLLLAESIKDFIHNKFQQVELPRFIRSVQVHSFEFGKESPFVELKDICDPLPEFYENEDDDDNGENSGDEEHVRNVETLTTSKDTHQPINNFSQKTHPSSTVAKPNFIDTRPAGLRSNFGFTDRIRTPLLRRSSTPGIPGGTSNLSYFHLPLSAGLSGTQTPLSVVAGGIPFPTDWEHHGTSIKIDQSNRHRSDYPDTDTSSRPSATESPAEEKFPAYTQDARKGSEPHSDTKNPMPDPMDTQVVLHISYDGTVCLSITAEILLDYPMPSFVGIPLKLNITGLSFDGVALVAYLRKRAHFCFLGPEDAQTLVGIQGHSSDGQDGSNTRAERSNNKLGGLLREIRVESEIGRKEGGKQVLKNVGKVEKFVLEQVRRIFEEEFVWPSFWTFLL